MDGAPGHHLHYTVAYLPEFIKPEMLPQKWPGSKSRGLFSVESVATDGVSAGQLSVSFLGPCCPAPLYCIAVHDCLMLTEQINDDDDDDDHKI